jgi:hypothetical protein
LETYLRCFSSNKQHQWVQWLPLEEWWYNTSYHTTTKMTSYETMHGQQPPPVNSYLPGTSKFQAINKFAQGRAATLAALKDNLHMSQNNMKQQANQQRSERVFQEGDQVFLRLQTYKKTSLKGHGHHKLTPKFYGPYQIIKRIGPIAYKLALPTTSKIHLVFHVSYLKKVVGHNCRVQTIMFELDEEISLWLQLESMLNVREHHLCGRTIKEVLIKWKDTSPEDATWELVPILQQFPHLQP